MMLVRSGTGLAYPTWLAVLVEQDNLEVAAAQIRSDSKKDAPALVAFLVVPGHLPHLGISEGDAVVGFYSRKLIGALMVPVTVVAVWHGAWAWLLGTWVLFGVGFWIWDRPGDWPHAVWHVTTAAAMTLILIGI